MSGSARGATRERKVAARLREIDRDRRALRNALDRFDGPQHFAATWASEDPDTIAGLGRWIALLWAERTPTG